LALNNHHPEDAKDLPMTAHNPWKTLSKRTVYDNPWIRVEDHEVLNPAGRPGQYGKICFKNQAVAIVAMDRERNVYLVGQYRYTLGVYSWELPKGGAPLTEDPLRAAQRELKEETGLTARRWRLLMSMHLSNSVTDERGSMFLAEDLEQGDAEPDETEHLAVERLPFAQTMEWVRTGKITDAVSIVALLRVASDEQTQRGPQAARADAPGDTRAWPENSSPS
jgi:8-oxo-dGTP pyrophosphatase MutT (NUDIX family)